MSCASRSVGGYRTSEIAVARFDRLYHYGGTRRGVVFCHGAAGTGDGGEATVQRLVDAGYPVMCADLSAAAYAGSNWGNADHIDAIGDAWAYLVSAYGAKTDKVLLFGLSMGVAGALAYARAFPSTVLAVAGGVPVLDVDDIYQNNKGSHRATIGTAYGVTHPTSLGDLSTNSPVAFSSSALAGQTVRLWAASNDPVASTTAACTTWGGKGATLTVTDLGAVGHDAAAVPLADVVQFFDTAGGRA